MRVTSKGQVTIPQEIRERLGIAPNSEVDFVEDEGRVYLRRAKTSGKRDRRLATLRGAATVGMTTDEILSLTRK